MVLKTTGSSANTTKACAGFTAGCFSPSYLSRIKKNDLMMGDKIAHARRKMNMSQARLAKQFLKNGQVDLSGITLPETI